jgi:hypothetical protein
MNTYDNHGKLVGQIEHFRTNDGKSVTSNATFNNGRVVSETVSVQDSKTGKVRTTNVIGGKVLP